MSYGSRPDAPKLKVDASFMMLLTNDSEWEQKVLQAPENTLCIIDCFSPMVCAHRTLPTIFGRF
jgi:hypothetical protein